MSAFLLASSFQVACGPKWTFTLIPVSASKALPTLIKAVCGPPGPYKLTSANVA